MKHIDLMLIIEKSFNDGIPTDLISIDTRQAIHHLGEIIGEIITDEIPGKIFREVGSLYSIICRKSRILLGFCSLYKESN
ncbi:MAG: hypothetical protein ACEPOV_14345 [Hyphomicrobiales bacterium]